MSEESRYSPSAVGGLRVVFDDDVPADERERIEESIGAMARHSVERRESQREVDAATDALRAAMARPLNQLIDAGSEEITSAIAQRRRHAEQFRQRERREFPAVRAQDLVFDFAPGTHSLQVFGVPFHFAWHWHSGTPDPDTLPLLDRPNGNIDVSHYTGFHGDHQISHHAGFAYR